ncbi:FKBP-type peptidyl-prolyl cis-trans isomerase, partial [Candidatus Woesearchaeota archaeon]|nr:FKBP-type peptidyl-prolyl cis-trans isomerase [Candidatus Woesearchaeota archaeon]
MEKIVKGSLVVLDYSGWTNGELFDTTIKEVAEKNNFKLDKPGPVTIVIGKEMILKGIEEFLKGKSVGSYKVKLPPEKAFGEKNPGLVTIIQEKKFKQQGIKPYPGLVVQVDGHIGRIKSVGSGRVIVDFNHPLAGLEVEYDLDVREVINEPLEKVKRLLEEFNIKQERIEEKEGKISVYIKDKKEEELKQIEKALRELLDMEIVVKSSE